MEICQIGIFFGYMGVWLVDSIGVVRGQHPTREPEHTRRVLCPHNTMNLDIIISIILRRKNGAGLSVGGGV
jgi:hypothetical protein